MSRKKLSGCYFLFFIFLNIYNQNTDADIMKCCTRHAPRQVTIYSEGRNVLYKNNDRIMEGL